MGDMQKYSHTAPVWVTLLRREGKRLKNGEAEHSQRYRGDICHEYVNSHPLVTMDTGHQSKEQVKKLPPPLYHPIIDSLDGTGMRIVGFEKIGESSYVQEWMIRFK